MKKFKEALCFILPILLLFVAYILTLGQGNFAEGIQNVINSWKYSYFGQTARSYYDVSLLLAFFAAVIFAVLQCFVRKKIKISAPAYYLVNVFAGSVAAFSNVMFLNWQFLRHDCVITLRTTFGDVLETINVYDILFCLLAGILAAFVIWLGALVWLHVKKLLAKPRKVDATEIE